MHGSQYARSRRLVTGGLPHGLRLTLGSVGGECLDQQLAALVADARPGELGRAMASRFAKVTVTARVLLVVTLNSTG